MHALEAIVRTVELASEARRAPRSIVVLVARTSRILIARSLEELAGETADAARRVLRAERAVALIQTDGVTRCQAERVGISAIERLPDQGVRLVCMSVHGAEVMRTKLKSRLLKGTIERFRIRPTRPLWGG